MVDGTSSKIEPIAIIGSSFRFPGGSNSPCKLRKVLKHPVDLLTEIPRSRFDPGGFYHENAEHPGFSTPECCLNYSYKQHGHHKQRTWPRLTSLTIIHGLLTTTFSISTLERPNQWTLNSI